ncbi:hypothetical protein D6D03_07208 [Aureobasidium pullulans]|nr:hypothetical protein D6D03_07208 [Aureobasidium pullulans]
MSAFSFTNLRFPDMWKAKRGFASSNHGYSRLRQPIYCAERSPHRAEQQSLGHTPMERKIDKRMAAYSNKFSAPGIDVDTVTQIVFSSSYVRPITTKTANARSFLSKSTLDFLPSKEHAIQKAWMPCLTTSSKSNDSNESTQNQAPYISERERGR